MITYEIGDMFWGKSQSYPWWPCLIMTNNNNEIKRTRKKIGTQYHVQFIGQYYDACWITNNFLIKYDGIANFESYVDQQMNSSLPPQHKSIYEMKMTGQIQSMWIQACRDAEKISQLPNLERILHLPKLETIALNNKKPKIKKKVSKPASKHSDSESGSDTQMIDSKCLDIEDSSPKDNKMNSDIEEICYRVYMAEELENRIKNSKEPVDQIELENLLKQQWSVLDIEIRLLYSDGDKLNISKSRVSGRKIKVPSRLRRTNELEDIKKATLKKRNSDIDRKKSSIDASSIAPSVTTTCEEMSVEIETVEPVMPSIQLNSVCRETLETSLLKTLKLHDSSMEMIKNIVKKELPVVIDICHQCLKPYKPNEKSKGCKGDCHASFHFMCSLQHKLFRSDDNSKCINCVPKEFLCCICKNSKYMKKQFLMKCKKPNCPHFFHSTCLRFINFIDLSLTDKADSALCPSHSCLTCNREDNKHPCNNLGSLVTCTRCPIAYHSSLLCIPAGSRIISAKKIICHRHFDHDVPSRNRLTRCFVCFLDNATLCCCRCRAVFHPKCINMPTYTDLLKDYVCPTCKLEHPIFYGQIMWTDIDNEWFPVEIIAPHREVHSYIQPVENKLIVCTISFDPQRRRIYHNADPSELVPFTIGESALKDFLFFDNQVMEKLRNMNTIYLNWRKWMRPFQSEKFSTMTPSELIRYSSLLNGVIPIVKYEKIQRNQIELQVKNLVPKRQAVFCSCCSDNNELCDNNACYNFINKIECNPENCKNAMCTNRKFTSGFPMKPIITDVQVISGRGVKIADRTNKGSLIGELVGCAISADRVVDLMNDHGNLSSNRYIFHMMGNVFLNCEQFGNEWRHLNHSCSPNAELVCWTISGELRLGVFLIKSIYDEEITINYQKSGLVLKYDFHCKCKSQNCCKKVGPTSIFANQANVIIPRCCIENNVIDESTIITNYTTKSVISRSSPTSVVECPTINQPTKPSKVQIKSEQNVCSEVINNQHKTVCHRCNTHGELICCNKAKCTKRYHLQCVEITASPKGLWFCPKHYCLECGHAAVSFCHNCCTSYCNSHSHLQSLHSCSENHISATTMSSASPFRHCTVNTVPIAPLSVETQNSDQSPNTDEDSVNKEPIDSVLSTVSCFGNIKIEENVDGTKKSNQVSTSNKGILIRRSSELKTNPSSSLKALPISTLFNKKDLYISCDLIPKVKNNVTTIPNNKTSNGNYYNSDISNSNNNSPRQVNLKIQKRQSSCMESIISENSKRPRLAKNITCSISNYLSTDEEVDANPESVENSLDNIRCQVLPMGIEDMENLIISPIILDD